MQPGASFLQAFDTLQAYLEHVSLVMDLDRAAPESESGAVQIMTLHGAKGLEAPVVILPDTATRQQIEGYLAHAQGLSASLPAAHPYKSAAPQVIA